MTTAIVFTCAHSKPGQNLERFDWLGNLIEDIRPDYVVDLGDFEEMNSLSSYDTRYPQKLITKSYEKDINSGQEARDRIWSRFRAKKKKRPYRIGFEGNHENRIKKFVAADPQLEGDERGVSFKHLQTGYWYDDYHEYNNAGPAIASYDGVSYAHYFSSGNFGAPVSGVHHAYSLLQKRYCSSTCGHSHKRGVYFSDGAAPHPILGLVAGNFKGDEDDWAGQAPTDWWTGIVIKHNIENGVYDPEFVSIERLRQVYGGT